MSRVEQGVPSVRRIQRRTDEQGVASVVAEILLVAMTVTLAATLFYMASNISTQATITNRPFVAFGGVSLQDGVATIPVVTASFAAKPWNFKVNLQVDGAFGTAAALRDSDVPTPVVVGGSTYQVTWHDVSGDGALNGGDPITVSAASGPLPSGTTFGFFLFWSDGTVVQSTAWSV